MTDIQTLKAPADGPADPFGLFGQWFAEAQQSEPSDPNAMCLATVGADGRPDARIVLLKNYDKNGFVFYTNMESKKGDDLKAHTYATLNFHWKTLGRTIRISGPAAPVAESESDTYYASRPRGSRIGAWASQQSRELDSRATLEARITEFEKKFEGQDDIPRPPYWYGTRVTPERIEFWHAGDYRLHTRLVYLCTAEGWEKHMLYP